MGVKGLFQFLKRFETDVNIPHFVAGKSVGIDIFWYIHKSKGDMFYLQNYLLPIIKHARQVHCVFDGNPTDEKRAYLEHQTQKREEMLQTIDAIEKYLKYPFRRISKQDRQHINECLNELKRQAWQPPPEYVDYVKNWLYNKGCCIYQASQEADTYLLQLQQNQTVSVIVTNDSDLLTLGASTVLRPVTPLRGAIFDMGQLCDILGFTEQQWYDFMYLCKNMKDTDISLAYSFISVYKDLEYIFQKYDSLYKDSLVREQSLEEISDIFIE
jgi:hypothetical protein